MSDIGARTQQFPNLAYLPDQAITDLAPGKLPVVDSSLGQIEALVRDMHGQDGISWFAVRWALDKIAEEWSEADPDDPAVKVFRIGDIAVPLDADEHFIDGLTEEVASDFRNELREWRGITDEED